MTHRFIPRLNSNNFWPSGTVNTRITVPWKEGKPGYHPDMNEEQQEAQGP